MNEKPIGSDELSEVVQVVETIVMAMRVAGIQPGAIVAALGEVTATAIAAFGPGHGEEVLAVFLRTVEQRTRENLRVLDALEPPPIHH